MTPASAEPSPATKVAGTASSSSPAPGPSAAPAAAADAIRAWATSHGWEVRRPVDPPAFDQRPVVYADLARAGERRRAIFHLSRVGAEWGVQRTRFLGCGGC